MTFSSVKPMKAGDGHNRKAVEQAGECLFSDTKVSQMRGGRRGFDNLACSLVMTVRVHGMTLRKPRPAVSWGHPAAV